ncbi:tyrosine-type recombinase/integrase [Virgibacillus sediminis]|uniref:Tyrosine-type recombinase/integrase n=1 Tax=Virgibacillus sediminis TaxID=202260 RepID=A0ABV7A389_9BACI
MDDKTMTLLHELLSGYAYRLQERTLLAYEQNIKAFFLFSQTPYHQIKASDIRKWMHHLQETGQKPTTIHQKIASLRLFFTYAIEEQLLVNNPTTNVALPKLEDKIPHYLKREELEQLRYLVKDSKRERAIIETMYTTGVRLGELIDMKQSDVSWEHRAIHIRNGKGKKERNVFFSQGCKQKIQDYLSTRTDDLPNLFLNSKGKPVQQRALRLTFEGYSDRLGFKVSPHTMRHTFAAHLAEKGMPLVYIQDLLGHDSIEVTKMYARLHEEARKRQYDYYV